MDCRPSRTRNPDLWLASCPEASRAICEELRDLVFRWEPDLAESIKWNMLCYSGRRLVCAIGGFRKYAGFTFFRGMELPDPACLFARAEANVSVRNIRVQSLADLNRPALRELLHAAVRLDAQPKMPAPPRPPREPWPMPPDLAKALKGSKAAAAFFASLKPTYQREYKVWVSTAKLPETRARRLKETLAALAAGRKWAQRRG